MGAMDSLTRGFRLLGDSLEDSVKLMRGEAKEYLAYFIAGAAALLAAFVIGVALIWAKEAFLGGSLGAMEAWVDFGIITVISILGAAAMLAAVFGGVEYAYYGKKKGYFKGDNLWGAFRWVLFCLLICAIVAAPLITIMRAIPQDMRVAKTILTLLVNALFIPAGMVIGFLLQYVYPELALNKRGPLSAIGASYSAVKKNFWESIVLFITTYVISIVAGMILYAGFIILAGAGLLAAILSPLLLLLVAAGAIILIVVYLLAIAFTLALIVKFYKQLKGGSYPRARR